MNHPVYYICFALCVIITGAVLLIADPEEVAIALIIAVIMALLP